MTAAGDLRSNPPRSLLFVPADRASELLPKAVAAGADGVIIDLEDAVLPTSRDAARAALAGVMEGTDRATPLLIRIGHPASEAFVADLELAAGLARAGVVLPKCAGPEDIANVVSAWSTLTARELVLIPIVETSGGVLAAAEIAASDPAIAGLAFGAEDLAAEVGFPRTGRGVEILVARSLVVLAATAAGRWAIDTPCLGFGRPEAVRRDAGAAAALGFAGKLLIHPAQVAPVHAAFRPTAAAVAAAEQTLRAADALARGGKGVGAVGSRMIDRPVIEAARRTLARAARYENERGSP